MAYTHDCYNLRYHPALQLTKTLLLYFLNVATVVLYTKKAAPISKSIGFGKAEKTAVCFALKKNSSCLKVFFTAPFSAASHSIFQGSTKSYCVLYTNTTTTSTTKRDFCNPFLVHFLFKQKFPMLRCCNTTFVLLPLQPQFFCTLLFY